MTVKLRAYNPVDVEIGESQYQSIDMPHKSAIEFQKLMDQISKIGDDEASEQEAIDLMLKGFDLILVPVKDAPASSELLRAGIDSGEITPRQFIGLWTDILEAIEEANGTEEVQGSIDRPT